jgi:hypothetical protein
VCGDEREFQEKGRGEQWKHLHDWSGYRNLRRPAGRIAQLCAVNHTHAHAEFF